MHREKFDNGGSFESVAELLEIAGKLNSSTVVIAGGDRTEDLRLVESARDHGIISRIILVGTERQIRKSVKKVGIEIEEEDIVPADDDEDTAEKTVDLVCSGSVDIVLKGNISTPVLNRRMLKIAESPTVSLASVFDAAPVANGRPIILTDAGVTTVCTYGRMVGLVQNAVEVARLVMGIDKPRVAILSANEKQIPSLRSTWIGKMLSERDWPHAFVYGPLSFDLATDQGSVQIKGLSDTGDSLQVAGRADVLVCPGIDGANILYKTLTAMVKYGQASIAGITVGFTVPYIILSRADALETRLMSIALCSIYRQRKKEREPRTGGGKPRKNRVLAFDSGDACIKAALFSGDRITEYQKIPDGKNERDTVSIIEGLLKKWDAGGIDGISVPGTETKKKERRGYEIRRISIPQGDTAEPEEPSPRRSNETAALLLSKRLGIPSFVFNPGTGSSQDGLPRDIFKAMSSAALLAARALGLPFDRIKLVVLYLFAKGSAAAVFNRGNIIRFLDPRVLARPHTEMKPSRAGRNRMDEKTGETSGPEETELITEAAGALFGAAGGDLEAVVLAGEYGINRSQLTELKGSLGRLAPVLSFEEPLLAGAAAFAATARAADIPADKRRNEN